MLNLWVRHVFSKIEMEIFDFEIAIDRVYHKRTQKLLERLNLKSRDVQIEGKSK